MLCTHLGTQPTPVAGPVNLRPILLTLAYKCLSHPGGSCQWGFPRGAGRGRAQMYDCTRSSGVDPRNLAQRIMEVGRPPLGFTSSPPLSAAAAAAVKSVASPCGLVKTHAGMVKMA